MSEKLYVAWDTEDDKENPKRSGRQYQDRPVA